MVVFVRCLVVGRLAFLFFFTCGLVLLNKCMPALTPATKAAGNPRRLTKLNFSKDIKDSELCVEAAGGGGSAVARRCCCCCCCVCWP